MRIGDTIEVGEICKDTGEYKHNASYCTQEMHLDYGDKVPPCQRDNCNDKGASWTLIKKS